jgi:hypothetical protein
VTVFGYAIYMQLAGTQNIVDAGLPVYPVR